MKPLVKNILYIFITLISCYVIFRGISTLIVFLAENWLVFIVLPLAVTISVFILGFLSTSYSNRSINVPEEVKPKAQIFLIYAKEDFRDAMRISSYLKEHNFKIITHLEYADEIDFRGKIDNLITESNLVVVLISQNYESSKIAKYELDKAKTVGSNIIPVQVGLSSSMSSNLFEELSKETTGVDLSKGYIKSFEKLINITKSLTEAT